MAVDFSLLPTEKVEPGEPPSANIWILVFLTLVLVGAFTVLMLWPKSMSTHTFDFWGTVVLFPVGLSALIVLLRYQHYAARKLDIQMDNHAIRQYNERVFVAASVPIAVLGASHRFSANSDENAVDGIRSGALRLSVQSLFARESEPEKTRWIDVPGVRLCAGTAEDDLERQIKVTRWLFKEMLQELNDAIEALPEKTELRVHVLASGMPSGEKIQALWQDCWNSLGLRSSYDWEQSAESASLQLLDVWLDQVESGKQSEAKLIVAIQLHALMGASPPVGAAEAGVALLLMPDAIATKCTATHRATIHRPVRGPFDLSNGALEHALQWAGLNAKEVSDGWQTGVSRSQAGALRTSAVQSGLEIQPVDLDMRVGHAGIAGPWLAVACSASSLSEAAPGQIVFAGQADGVDCALLRNMTAAEQLVFSASSEA